MSADKSSSLAGGTGGATKMNLSIGAQHHLRKSQQALPPLSNGKLPLNHLMANTLQPGNNKKNIEIVENDLQDCNSTDQAEKNLKDLLQNQLTLPQNASSESFSRLSSGIQSSNNQNGDGK